MSADWRTSATLPALQFRARMLAAVRAWFDAAGVMELETPLLAGSAVTDLHLASMEVLTGDGVRHYLNTSPEYCMKRFLAEHGLSVYQVCKCFRAGEAGPAHNPEFTMLEWYRTGYDLESMMAEVAELLAAVMRSLDMEPRPVRRTSYRRLFQSGLGIDPHKADIEALNECAVGAGLDIPAGMATGDAGGAQSVIDRNAWLDWLLSCFIAPRLDPGEFTFIHDFPASQAALARLDDSGTHTVARRFEVYAGTMELANGYDELRDSREQVQRFAADNSLREHAGLPVGGYDRHLLSALDHGLPQCAGVAIGIDRLLASLLGLQHIAGVLAYDYTKV